MAIWNLANRNRQVRVLPAVHQKSIRNAVWSINETELVSVSYDQSCALTDVESG